ncbi:hypothetical protein K2X05_06205, partial [bacterium]|nr:hypothetical protein [bacterium]
NTEYIRSTDGLRTFSFRTLPTKIFSIVFNGTNFIGWGDGKVYLSSDGLTWMQSAMQLNGMAAPWWIEGPISFNPRTGTYVLITSVWGNFYAKQKAYRSKDGVRWDELSATAFKGGHPLGHAVLGQVDSSSCNAN